MFYHEKIIIGSKENKMENKLTHSSTKLKLKQNGQLAPAYFLPIYRIFNPFFKYIEKRE